MYTLQYIFSILSTHVVAADVVAAAGAFHEYRATLDAVRMVGIGAAGGSGCWRLVKRGG
jgi:hypothetical protein